MQIFKFFPLIVYRSSISFSENEKNTLIDEVKNMKKNSKNLEYKNELGAWTGDTQGHEYIHKNKKFDNLFKEIKKKIIEYLNVLNVDSEKLDIYIQRSWATISSNKESIATHSHLQSHISFAYYLKKKPTDAKLIFYDQNKYNEILPGLFDSKTIKQKKIVKAVDFNNAPSIFVEANEGDIIIFPSKTLHGTDPSVTNNDRISLSADIILAAKDTESLEHLMPPIQNWQKI